MLYALYHDEKNYILAIKSGKFAETTLAGKAAKANPKSVIPYNDNYELSTSKASLRDRAEAYKAVWLVDLTNTVNRLQELKL